MSRASLALPIVETPAQTVDHNFRVSAKLLDLGTDLQAILSTPRREVHMRIPLRMDDGALAMFESWLVQHNTVRGPSLNALRMDACVDSELERALAEMATWGCALVNLPFGGAASGIACTPSNLSARELEALTRAFTSRARRLIGVYEEIIAPDLNTPGEVMGWVVDEYSTSPDSVSASVTGKPVAIGGALNHEIATGRGARIAVREMARDIPLELKGARVIVQGLGAAGRSVARELVDLGCIVIGVSNGSWALYSGEGIRLEAILSHPEDSMGTLAEVGEAEAIEADDLLAHDCEILVSAAGESALNGSNAADVRARMILEISTLATTPAADLLFEQLGITVIPGILASAGAMVASFLEWEQNLEQKRWVASHAEAQLEAIMLRACRAVQRRAQQDGISLRSAAHCIALERVARMEKLRGI